MIIRLADCPSQPWKNGLGRTREIAVHPALAHGDDFDWRVSIAEVDSAAPFSLFPGIDRQIALLDGAGFTMTLDDGRIHALTTPFVPFAFPGEAKVTVALASGPTRDFNLMLRRARVRGEVQAWTEAGTRTMAAGTALVFCARGAIDTADGRLQAGDAWRPDAAGAVEITLHDATVALVVRVEAVAG
ncbi:histidine utilization protein HutD [Rhodanobacter sp. Root561]|uniref:HutD/Ves family protein n=1 Tax=Rhodanobacter sp. Root561 TaxID=1736560 RepID=UPI0006FCE495|nr:HutD family protein [Rhodanobacter sp. Root561]KQZ79634.1 histidine utilization protein HutD [Rhodanobacter sp. Root561]